MKQVDFNKLSKSDKFTVIEAKNHNRTDGEVHYVIVSKSTHDHYEYHGNIYNQEIAIDFVDWLSKQ